MRATKARSSLGGADKKLVAENVVRITIFPRTFVWNAPSSIVVEGTSEHCTLSCCDLPATDHLGQAAAGTCVIRACEKTLSYEDRVREEVRSLRSLRSATIGAPDRLRRKSPSKDRSPARAKAGVKPKNTETSTDPAEDNKVVFSICCTVDSVEMVLRQALLAFTHMATTRLPTRRTRRRRPAGRRLQPS